MNHQSAFSSHHTQQAMHLHDEDAMPIAPEAIPFPPRDHQVGGNHYKKLKVQPWDVIDACGLGYYEGNAVKYIMRRKPNASRVEDLRKAIHYLEKQISIVSAEGEG
jgi:hypothetical protein